MRKELLLALVVYVLSMTVLLMAVYRFLENWQLDASNFYFIGTLLFLLAVGWGYILSTVIFVPSKNMEETLATLTKDIIHELNIPLSTIKANTTLLNKSLQDEKSLKRLQRIDDASIRLEKLYKELVYTIQKEMHTIEKEIFDIKMMIEERVAIFKEQERNTFELELESYEIKADKIGFEQMIDNILSNAMKYSNKASPICITLDKGKLCIKDRGIGMSSSELLRIYERYFQSDKRNEGEGIGLALVKAYCDSEGIEIRIESEKGEGTEVCLDLSVVYIDSFIFNTTTL